MFELRTQYRRHGARIRAAILRVLRSGRFVLGPEVEAFEREFARSIGARSAIGVASGTDAIMLTLVASGISPGDEVITVSHTASPTVGAIVAAGGTPVLVDIDPATLTMDPAAAAAAIGPRTVAIMPVHLYGCPADMRPLRALARRHQLLLIEDAAQAHGGRYRDRTVGTLADVACFSFYPTKNLGALGDGGAVVTDDARLAERVRRLRMHGERKRFVSEEPGYNSRLDELQAAILRVKLPLVAGWVRERRRLAARYRGALAGDPRVGFQEVPRGGEHAYHLFVVSVRRRDGVRTRLHRRGVQTLVHYPVPVHLQPAYRDLGLRRGSLPVTERAARQVVSLPLYPELGERRQRRVIAAVRDALR